MLSEKCNYCNGILQEYEEIHYVTDRQGNEYEYMMLYSMCDSCNEEKITNKQALENHKRYQIARDKMLEVKKIQDWLNQPAEQTRPKSKMRSRITHHGKSQD